MGIRFYCPECDRRMNVKSFLAGKRGICPHCDARWDVPLESQIPEGAPKVRPNSGAAVAATAAVSASSESMTETQTQTERASIPESEPAPSVEVTRPTSEDPIDAAPDAVWYVRPASGGEFGPARGDVMRRWMEEGRVGADSMVWREGWPEWQIAGPIFPALTPGTEPTPAATQPVVEPKTLASLGAVQKKTVELNGRASGSRGSRSIGSGKSIAAVVILGLMIVALFVVLIVVVRA